MNLDVCIVTGYVVCAVHLPTAYTTNSLFPCWQPAVLDNKLSVWRIIFSLLAYQFFLQLCLPTNVQRRNATSPGKYEGVIPTNATQTIWWPCDNNL